MVDTFGSHASKTMTWPTKAFPAPKFFALSACFPPGRPPATSSLSG